ncbi:hypothetical protein HFZ78_18715 [Priestia megaterium]|uniref:Uncharacterized protein n=1 Tax=Priestia megaterium TaxID=1404 RepID=A0A6H1P4P0_PRIMG|nr:hypothetical protein [Priestia megaterium]QIZ08488.1 hypothetical protein HFZ78_18715 [Priestia megaterium]
MNDAEKEKIEYLLQYLHALRQASDAGVIVHREVKHVIAQIDELLKK